MIKMNEKTYYANVGRMQCESCGSEAIISIERLEKLGVKIATCPYCKSRHTRMIARTTDENRGEFHFGTFTIYEPVE